jgi:hypothetical protein
MTQPNLNPNGGEPMKVPLVGEVVIQQSQVSVGVAPNGEIILIVNPAGTGLNLVIVMGKPEASQIGKALVAQGSGIVMP